MDLHSHEVITEDSYVDGVLEDRSDHYCGGVPHRADLDGRDVITYFYYEPQMASRGGWKPGPTWIANKVPPAPTYLGHAVGCGRQAAPAPAEGAAEQHAEALGALDLVDDDGADDRCRSQEASR
eukprot:4890894-Pyramimonas_sp.AAC.1